MIKPGAKLGDDYQARSLPVVKRRLYQVGVFRDDSAPQTPAGR
jgi:hypothetical protein